MRNIGNRVILQDCDERIGGGGGGEKRIFVSFIETKKPYDSSG